jgi:hypothetical protein
LHALRDAEAVLFVHDGQPQVLKGHVLLEYRVGAHQDADLAAFERGQLRAPLGPFVAAGQQCQPDAGRAGQRRQPLHVLAGENLGRGHHHALPARLDRREQRQKRHQRLARAHVALQQAVHPLGRGHVRSDLFDRAGLRAGGRIG